MRNLTLIGLLLTSCDSSSSGHVEFFDTTPPTLPRINQHSTDTWHTVGRATINVRKSEGVLDNQYKSYGLAAKNVTHTTPITNQFDLDFTAFTPGVEDSSSTLPLGSIDIDGIKINKLKQCGGGGNEKCGKARIIIYTTELASNPGVEGFVHVLDGYGVDIHANDIIVGLASGNAAEVELVLIPESKKRVGTSDFANSPFIITGDFSNAGYGDYEADIVIDIQLAL